MVRKFYDSLAIANGNAKRMKNERWKLHVVGGDFNCHPGENTAATRDIIDAASIY